jgi:hypothetical protein
MAVVPSLPGRWRYAPLAVVVVAAGAGFALLNDDDEPSSDTSGSSALTVEPADATASSVGDSQGSSIAAEPGAAECDSVTALAEAVGDDAEIDIGLPWDQLQAQIVTTGSEVATAYGAVAAIAPTEVVDDLEVLVDYNQTLSDVAAQATSLVEFQAGVIAPSADVLTSTEVVDQYMRDTCAVGLSAN